MAASFMRTVISAYRFAVSKTDESEPAADHVRLDVGFEEMDGRRVS